MCSKNVQKTLDCLRYNKHIFQIKSRSETPYSARNTRCLTPIRMRIFIDKLNINEYVSIKFSTDVPC